MSLRPYYESGGITIYHGDCREVLVEMADNSVDMVFTDPPYGHNNNNGDLAHKREEALGLVKTGKAVAGVARPIANVVRVPGLKPAAWDHPTPKPPELVQLFVQWHSLPDDLVLDPFMGGGTTLRVAKDLGRRAIGIELEERYCEMAARRLDQEVLAL